jgi:Fic family protein
MIYMSQMDDLLTGALNNMSTLKHGGGIAEQQYKEVVAWWQSQPRNSVDDYVTLLDNFRIIFACNSSNIEGNLISYHTTREVFSDGNVTGYSGALRDLFEVRNQKFAFNAVLNYLIGRRKIDSKLILKLHRILLYGTYDDTRWSKGERPGTYKVNDYCVGCGDTGSYPEEVPGDVESLIEEINDENGDVLTTAAYLHLQFESIHPFADGNGRLGRLILNYYLMLNDYPPVVIFNEDKETYYLALEVWDKTDKLDGFKQFIMEETVKTWRRKIEK